MGFRMLAEVRRGSRRSSAAASRNIWGFRPQAAQAATATAAQAGEGASAVAKASPGAGGILGDVVLQRNLESRVKHLAVAPRIPEKTRRRFVTSCSTVPPAPVRPWPPRGSRGTPAWTTPS